jgi:hypothetical protein
MNDVFCEARKQQEIEESLRLLDSSNWDIFLSHAKQNLSRSYSSLLDLKGAFKDIPAILVGSGPSLERNGHLLELFRSKAIMMAGGTALEKLLCKPHFGALLDANRPVTSSAYPSIPLCFQARMHPDNLDLFQGDLLLSPDGHFSFLNCLSGDEALFDCGWTVGNFMVALSVHFGCNPIVCVGMDYCYNNDRKYAFGGRSSLDGLVESSNQFGKRVWTQSDWVMAVSWMETFSRCHKETTFLNASTGGLSFFTPCTLDSLVMKEIPNLQGKVDQAIASLPKKCISSFQKWDESVLRCRNQFNSLDLDEEIVYLELLLPLWQIWKNPLSRLEDPFPISFEKKMEIHQRLFFEQVLDRCLQLQ